MRVLYRTIACVAAVFVVYTCGVGTRRIDAAELAHGPRGPVLRVAIFGAQTDPRIATVREALAFWNQELGRLGRSVRFDSGIVVSTRPLPEDVVSSASAAQSGPRAAYFNAKLRRSLDTHDAEAGVALSNNSEVISFGVPFDGHGRPGIVALRPMSRWPLTLPNVARNVAVHELGHLLGLPHNNDSRALMCGRPAECRPAAFASEVPHIFPLTAADEALLRRRWP